MKIARFFLSLLLATASGWAAVPVLDPPDPAKVAPNVPIGKVLLLPITASDADGDRLTFTVTSDQPSVKVRVRTGHPKLKMQVDHAGDGTAADPAFTGVLEFALLSDLTPITAAFMGGFAQAGYFNNQISHRIADLNPFEDADGSFIVQTGDPTAETDPENAGKGGPGFTFENEFRTPLIFAGRGQLAMANSGFAKLINPFNGQPLETYRATNGSQFFITAGQPRFLDFNHTIWGQLLRGWDTLAKMTAVPRNPAPTPPADLPAKDSPKVPLRFVSATVEPDFADALLLISATAPGTAMITVTATDGNGGTDTKTFTVTAFKDETNDPPFVMPVANQSVAKDKSLSIPFKVVDLEHDYLFPVNEMLKLPPTFQANGSVRSFGNPVRIQGNAGYSGQLDLGLGVQQYDMTYRGERFDGAARPVDDRTPVKIAVGDKAIDARIASFSAAPGAMLTGQVVATFIDTDALAQGSQFTATINWGDGAAPTAGVIVRNPASPLPTAFAVTGTHTYANAGTYPLVVELASTQGNRATLRGLAVITNGPLRPFGRTFRTKGAKLTNGIIATFKDDAPLSPLAYTVKIAWGDGTHSDGSVRRGPTGDFQVLGTHVFPDPEDYSVVVRIHKFGADPATDGTAWSLAEARSFKAPVHLPPFTNPNLIGQFGQTGTRPLRTTSGSQTFGIGQFVALNAGNKASKPGSVRFYLSEDTELNTADGTVPDPLHPGQTMPNPKDQPILVGASKLAAVSLPAFPAGRGLNFTLDQGSGGDARLRFPSGETGGGLNLLAQFIYLDPLADNLPIERTVVFGPYDPFVVSPTSLEVQEAAGAGASAQFKVKLSKQPRTDVVIALVLSTDAQKRVLVDKTSLTFTSANWNADQTVTVTAKDDGETGDHALLIQLQPATASTGTTDIRFHGLDPADVFVTAKHQAAP